MTVTVQITFDCVDPHAQAAFWAAALGLEVEADEAAIRELLEAGIATDADVTERDGHLVWKEAAAARDAAGGLPRMYFQTVPEPRATKNRVHLDLHVGPDRRAAEVLRLQALGATVAYEGHQGHYSWITMHDPEGNELCVA